MLRSPALVSVGGLVVLVSTATMASALVGPAGWELGTARFAFDLPSAVSGVLRAVMQVGTRGAIVVVAVALALAGRGREGAAAAAAGFAAWGITAVAKQVVGRPRPDSEALGRAIREIVGGPGFPSTHTAIAIALATTLVLLLRLPRSVALLVMLAATLTAVARMHLGVHWPLDVMGGAGAGLACGAGVAALVRR